MDQLLTFDVNLAGRFVQDQHIRFAQECSGERDSLHLSTGQPHSVGAEHGVVTMTRLVANEFIGERHLRSADDGVRIRTGRSVTDVVFDRIVKQHRSLSHQRDASPQVAGSHLVDRRVIQQHLTALRIVETT